MKEVGVEQGPKRKMHFEVIEEVQILIRDLKLSYKNQSVTFAGC